MATFDEFKADLSREVELFKTDIQKARNVLALAAYSSVLRKTPVDTGFARNSWFVEVGDGTDRESNGGSGGPTANEAVSNAGPFDSITIGNGAVYIRQLEDGRSNQAPRGMVEPTIAQLQSQFRRIESGDV